LLKAISHRIIPGLPDNLRILLVSQIDDHDEAFLLAGEDDGMRHDPELTVAERVVKSDQRREKALREQQG
jgi:ATP-binding cassette subfamily F protein 3